MIDKYIAELLKTNTRVIVPDFGAFMVKTSPGSKDKQVSFNDFLKYNDGLLVNHVAKTEGTIKEEAQKKVKAFVDEIQKELKANKPYKIESLGYLYKDPRGSIRFKEGDEKPAGEKPADKTKAAEKPAEKPKTSAKPEEQKPKASVTLDDKPKETPTKKPDPKVEKKPGETPQKTSDKKPAEGAKTINEKLGDKKPATQGAKAQVKTGAPEAKKPASGAGGSVPPKSKAPQTKPPQKQKNNSGPIIIVAAIVVVVGAAAVIGYLNWDTVQGWFGGSIFGKDEPKEQVVDSAAIKAQQARRDSLRKVQARKDSIEQARMDSIRKAEELKKKNQKKYYLVAGSFKTKKYAQMFVDKLNDQGYNSEIFMEKRGFYRVSYNSYVDRQKAFNEYRRMKNQDVQVWVLRH